MEEKYPIKFSLGQFILLLGVSVVVLSLVFLLGARFGGNIFPDFYANQFNTKSPYHSLEPEKRAKKKSSENSDLLVDTLGEAEEEGDVAADAPHYEVGADGEQYLVEDEDDPAPSRAGQSQDHFMVNKTLLRNPNDKDTMVRFKSSGHTKFTVQVGEYFDELIAAQKISILKKKGIDAYLVISNPNASSPIYTVQVGTFTDRKVAEDYAIDMSNSQNMELRVVRAN